MRVCENHDIDILRADPGHLQPRADRAGGVRGLTCAGIEQDHVASGLDQQAGVGAEHFVRGKAMVVERVAQHFRIALGKNQVVG